MAASSQPISIARDQRSQSGTSAAHLSAFNAPSNLNPSFAGSPMLTSGSSLLAHQPPYFANPRYAGTSPRSAESSTSWSIHPGPLFVSAGSLGSTSGSLGANSVISTSAGSFKTRMYPGLGCSPAAQILNPLEPDFKFRGFVGSMESDHGSLIDPHMSEREVEQFRNFSCCGLPLGDLHALVEHFETNHILLVDPLNPTQPISQNQIQPLNGFVVPPSSPVSNAGPNSISRASAQAVPTSNDSSLAGALGPSTSSPLTNGHTNENSTHAHGSTAAAGFDLDDMELDMDPEPESAATSPAPSASSSSHANSTNSNRSSPLGAVGAGPPPLTQPRRFANANGASSGAMSNGTMSSVSSPPDTPLLTTPVSPFASAPLGLGSGVGSQTGSFGQGQAQGQEGLMGMASSFQTQSNQQQQQQQVPAGPAAFDTVHFPAKHAHGGMFAHPYAGASARRHATHPLSPLSSASTSGANSPASATAGFGFGFQNQHNGLHHTQSLYALRFQQFAEQRERERELAKRAINGYAGYEDYSRGFPGTGEPNQVDIGIAGTGSGFGDSVDGGMGTRMNVGTGVGPTESAIHPGLLFGNANGNAANGNVNGVMNGQVKTEPATARTTPEHSRSGSPSSSSSGVASRVTPNAAGSSANASSSTVAARKTPQASTTLSRPSSSLLLSKPFKCPTPGCTKSYKQANGLKYHVTHGQCSFTPPPEYSSISELGLSMGVNLKLGPMGLEGLDNLSEKDRREAEREAERRLRPFCCQVKPCTRRYKNMNGLRYHYQHSGEHGAIGLRMLAEGRHDATRSQSVERSDEEEYRETQRSVERNLRRERGEDVDGEGADVGIGTGEKERGRKREKKDTQGGQTSSAPSTPGPSRTPAQRSPFATQASMLAFQQQQQQNQQQQHQRSLSGSQQQQQPRSPLSQQFPPPANQFASPQLPNGITNQNQFVPQGMNGLAGQFAFAVQSQPASAYASPWGSRAGSPTSTNSGQWAAAQAT